jgi:hypothetical protein
MPTTTAEEITREQLRAFHLSGRGLEHARSTERIRPAGLDAILADIPRLETTYPLYVAPNLLPRPLLEFPGVNETIVGDVIAIMGDRPLVTVAEARGVIPGFEECGIPAEGYLIGFHPDAAVLLYGAFLEPARRGARRAFFLEVKRCVAGLEDLLAIDRVSRAPHAADTVSASLGAAAKRFFAANALTGIFAHQSRRRNGMDPARLARCESALEILKKALDGEKRNPAFWLFHSGEAPADLAVFGGKVCRHDDSCAAAIEFCDQQLAEFTGVLRALRAARLEIESAFDPEVHSALLDRFDWRSAEPDELAALPALVIMEQPAQLARLSMASFARLLRSGWPVQILVPSCGPFADAETPDYGFLAVAHREAFVLRSSLARWEHLAAGLGEMTHTFRPTIGILAAPAARELSSDAWVETALYDLSGTFPLYRYDPDRDFQLLVPGVYSELRALQAMAISNRFRDHFRLIPPSVPNDGQMDAAEYFKSPAPHGLPVLAVCAGEDNQWRAVFTRDLVDLCRDRRRAMEMLTRLASVPETKDAMAGFEAARQEGAAAAYAVVRGLLADPEKLIASVPENSRAGS